jgi:hypothetical protein
LKKSIINEKTIYLNDAKTGFRSISAKIVNEKFWQKSITTLLFKQNLMDLQKKHSIVFSHDGKQFIINPLNMPINISN